MQTANIAEVPAKGDGILVRETRSGIAGAYDQLVERYFGMIYAVGLARLSDSGAAEDLAQEVFLRAYLCLDRLQHPEFFAAWITRMARNLATDWQRRGARGSRIATMVPLDDTHLEVPDTRTPGARERMETEEEQQVVRAALRRLSPEQREIVLLRFMEDMTQEEIGARLGINRSSVSRSLDKALGRMRVALVPVLRDAMPRLRAPKAATARTLAVVGAAAGLASAQKAAMAAAAVAGIQAAEAHTVSSGAGAAVSATLSLVKSISGVFTSGGRHDGDRQERRGGSGGVDHSGRRHIPCGAGGKRTESRRVRAGASRRVAHSPQGAAVKQYKDWNEMARDYLAQNPGNTGLAKLVEALSVVNALAVGQQKRALDAVIADGWSAPNPPLEAVIRAQTTALEAAFAAAQSAPFGMPPAVDSSTPVPNFLATQTLFKLMLATARMAEAAGDADGAAQRAVATARLAESFCGGGTTLISHLIGIAGVNSSCKSPRLGSAQTRIVAAGGGGGGGVAEGSRIEAGGFRGGTAGRGAQPDRDGSQPQERSRCVPEGRSRHEGAPRFHQVRAGV